MKPGIINRKTVLAFVIVSIVVCFWAHEAKADIVINEVMASNDTIIQDPYGDYSDWFELYNNGASAVDLTGYHLFDSAAHWIFPSVQLQPGAYLLVWCNDVNDPSTMSTNFKLSASGEILTLRDTNFALVDEVSFPVATPDESYGRYPNGTGEFERMDDPSPGSANVSTTVDPNPLAQYIKINEVVTSNNSGYVDEDGDASDWIEFYNTHPSENINLEGLRIADTSRQWVFPAVTINAGDYLLVWASDKDRTSPQLHANFKLSSGGETLTFYNTDGTSVEDTMVIPGIIPDNSFGCYPDGSENLVEMVTPTPLSANIDIPITNNPDHENITINEVVPDNRSGLRDLDNGFSDWIELYNKGSIAVDLEGLRIADTERVWACPAGQTLNPGDYLVIFASGKNITTGDQWHTNFSISSTLGDTLQLLHKDGTNFETVVTTQAFPADYSYGREPNGAGNFRNYEWPTPGALNEVLPDPDPNPDAAHIIINEVVSDNSSGLQDEDGDYSDWIELYNEGAVAVSLQGLKISDSSSTPTLWVFPDVTLGPDNYLILFCSDKDRLVGELHANFKLSADGETVTFINLDNSEISTVSVEPLMPNQSYGIDPDTGLYTVFTQPTPGAYNDPDPIVPNPDAGLITINEVSSDNETVLLDEDGTAQDWIELYNTSADTAVNLIDLKLRDSGDVWSFPDRVLNPGEYLVVFASDKNRIGDELHTNFKLESNGEILSLLNKDSILVEQILIPQLFSDQSFAYFPDGDGERIIFDVPTPGIANGYCADLNRSGGSPDISDLTYLVSYMFSGGPMPDPLWTADVNGADGGPDISDLTYLVSYMFSGGPAPDCNGDGLSDISSGYQGDPKEELMTLEGSEADLIQNIVDSIEKQKITTSKETTKEVSEELLAK